MSGDRTDQDRPFADYLRAGGPRIINGKENQLTLGLLSNSSVVKPQRGQVDSGAFRTKPICVT